MKRGPETHAALSPSGPDAAPDGPALKPFRQPNTLIYGRLDLPPTGTLAVLVLQHAALVSIFLIVAVSVARLAGLSEQDGRNFLALTMIAGGIGTILQALGRFGIGSGYLVPSTTTTILLPGAAAALALGGLPLLLGMTVYAGLITLVLSRTMHLLRPLFSPAITGFVILMVGLSVVVLAMRNFLGVGAAEAEIRPTILVASLCLATMVAVNIWGGSRLRLFCTLIGICVGYAAAALFGLFDATDLSGFHSAPLISLPHPAVTGISFDVILLVPFTIAAVAVALNGIGAISAAQRVEDPDLKRPDTASLARGIAADGLTNVFAGLLGGFGQASTSGAVGLSQATGANSRVIGLFLGAFLVSLAFVPKVSFLLLAMPAPVIGAALTFSGCFLVTSAIQMMASRMLDARKIFVLGIAFSLGIADFVYPQHFAAAPGWLAPWVSSPLSIAVTAAVLLNLLFRLGIHQRSAVTFDSVGFVPQRLADFMAAQGALWGAPPDLVYRAEFMTVEAVETLIASGLIHGPAAPDPTAGEGAGRPVTVTTRFDEFTFTVTISYRGEPMTIRREAPSADAVIAEDGHLLLSAYMLGRAADKVRGERQGVRAVLVLTLRN